MSHEPDHQRSGQAPSVHQRWKLTSLWREDTSSSGTGRWSSHIVLLWWYPWESFGHKRCRESKKRWSWSHRKVSCLGKDAQAQDAQRNQNDWYAMGGCEQLYRSRLVAQEVKEGSGFDEFFAAMPSLSALKMLVTIAVTFQLPHAGAAGKEAYAKWRLVGFLDLKRTRHGSFMWNFLQKPRNLEKM